MKELTKRPSTRGITPKQQRLAELIISTAKSANPPSKGELLERAGYSHYVGKGRPTEVIEAEGTQRALAIAGFTEENAKARVSEILHTGEESNSLRAADMIFKVTGSYAAEKHITVNVDIEPSNELRELAAKLLSEQKGA